MTQLRKARLAPDRVVEVSVNGNAAVTALHGQLATRYPAEAVARDRAGEVVDRAVPVVRGRGPLSPDAVCRGVELPARPLGRPRIGLGPTTVRDVCRTAGLPSEAYRRDGERLLLLYADGTLLGTIGDRIGGVSHLMPGGEFPPRFTDLLPPARKLGHYPATSRP